MNLIQYLNNYGDRQVAVIENGIAHRLNGYRQDHLFCGEKEDDSQPDASDGMTSGTMALRRTCPREAPETPAACSSSFCT